MGFTSDACWFLLIKTLLIEIIKKREAALKNEAGGGGGDDKHVFFFFTWPKLLKRLKSRDKCIFFFCYLLFPMACFLYTLLPSAKDTLELLGQILIKRNIRY